MVTMMSTPSGEYKQGNTVLFRINSKGDWLEGTINMFLHVSNIPYAQIKHNGRRYYTALGKLRPINWLLEDDNPNRTFKSRKE